MDGKGIGRYVAIETYHLERMVSAVHHIQVIRSDFPEISPSQAKETGCLSATSEIS